MRFNTQETNDDWIAIRSIYALFVWREKTCFILVFDDNFTIEDVTKIRFPLSHSPSFFFSSTDVWSTRLIESLEKNGWRLEKGKRKKRQGIDFLLFRGGADQLERRKHHEKLIISSERWRWNSVCCWYSINIASSVRACKRRWQLYYWSPMFYIRNSSNDYSVSAVDDATERLNEKITSIHAHRISMYWIVKTGELKHCFHLFSSGSTIDWSELFNFTHDWRYIYVFYLTDKQSKYTWYHLSFWRDLTQIGREIEKEMKKSTISIS